ncbi:MAG: DUF177 domain-containing protein [Thiotrichales bacterium]|nr:DUF177 domain-containing protein [Thiotrichales bacterium]
MLNKLPDYIDPIYAVKHNKHYVGQVKIAQLLRLAQQLESSNGEVSADITFFYDKVLGFPAFEMKLSADLNLQCQRSLASFVYPVQAELKGVLTESMALVEDLPAEVEAFTLDDERISLYELIEEELLLCVPMVPINESSVMAYENTPLAAEPIQTITGSDEPQSEKQNPFAVLQELKK